MINTPIRNADDARAYVRFIEASLYQYHWDDSPADVVWRVPADVGAMCARHAEVWAHVNPWDFVQTGDDE